MDRPSDSQKPPRTVRAESKTSKPATGVKAVYLILYNAISTAAWAVVLARTIHIASTQGYEHVYDGVGEWTKWTQTLAGLEVMHAALGIVRAPLLTTVMQVASRFLLVWGVVHLFPAATAAVSPAYTSMLTAWSFTEVVRYSYFASSLALGGVAGWHTWLRYNTFYVLYPLGIASECWLVGRAATGPAAEAMAGLDWVLYGVLAVYVPGSYVLFTHMMRQRGKVMRAERERKRV